MVGADRPLASTTSHILCRHLALTLLIEELLSLNLEAWPRNTPHLLAQPCDSIIKGNTFALHNSVNVMVTYEQLLFFLAEKLDLLPRQTQQELLEETTWVYERMRASRLHMRPRVVHSIRRATVHRSTPLLVAAGVLNKFLSSRPLHLNV